MILTGLAQRKLEPFRQVALLSNTQLCHSSRGQIWCGPVRVGGAEDVFEAIGKMQEVHPLALPIAFAALAIRPNTATVLQALEAHRGDPGRPSCRTPALPLA